MLNRLSTFNDEMQEKKHEPVGEKPKKKLTEPSAFEDFPTQMQDMLGGPVIDQVRLLGIRTGEMHIALAAGTQPEFKPEDFSLHYQRSLFSSFQSLVRSAFQNQTRNLKNLNGNVK